MNKRKFRHLARCFDRLSSNHSHSIPFHSPFKANVPMKRLHSNPVATDFECEKCPKRFRHDEHLYGEGITYSFHLCKVKFNKKRCLEAHIKAIHSLRTLYKCPIAMCSKTFTSKSIGYIHMKGVHAKTTKKLRFHLALAKQPKKSENLFFGIFGISNNNFYCSILNSTVLESELDIIIIMFVAELRSI